MKKLLYLVVLLIMPLAGFGQTSHILGNATGIGQTLTLPVQLQVQLVGCQNDVPRLIPSGSVITNQFTVTANPTTFAADALVYGNDTVICNNQSYTTYAVTWLINSRPAAPTRNYRVAAGATCNISDGTCLPIGFYPSQVQNSNGSLCPAGYNLQGYNSSFVPQCVLAPPAGPIGPQGPAGTAGGAQVSAGITTLLKGNGTLNQTAAAIAGTDYPGLGSVNTFSGLQTLNGGITVAGTATLPGGYAKTTSAASQTIAQSGTTSLGVSNINNLYNASLAAGSDIGAKVNAVIALCAGNPCPIYIPAGTYSFTTPIVLASNVDLSGAGISNTKLLYSGATTTYAITASTDNSVIHDFSLTGPLEVPSNLSSYNTVSGIALLGNHNTIHNMFVAHFWQIDGMIKIHGTYNTVSDSDLEYGAYIILMNGSNHIIRHNYASNHYSQAKSFEAPLVHYWDGIASESVQNTLIDGNTTIDNAAGGIYTGGGGFGNAFGNRITNNFVQNNWQHGIDTGVTGDVTAGNSVTNTVIANNVSIDNAGANIWSVCNQGMAITGNFVAYTPGYTTFFGTSIPTSNAGIAIAEVCGSAALDVESNVSVTGNTIMSSSLTQGVSYNVIKGAGNMVLGNSNTGSQVDFLAAGLDLTKNTYNVQNIAGQNLTNPVKITNSGTPLTLCNNGTNCASFATDTSGDLFAASSGTFFNVLTNLQINGGANISNSNKVMQTTATAPGGTCTLNGFITVTFNGVSLHLATCT